MLKRKEAGYIRGVMDQLGGREAEAGRGVPPAPGGTAGQASTPPFPFTKTPRARAAPRPALSPLHPPFPGVQPWRGAEPQLGSTGPSPVEQQQQHQGGQVGRGHIGLLLEAEEDEDDQQRRDQVVALQAQKSRGGGVTSGTWLPGTCTSSPSPSRTMSQVKLPSQ